MNVRLQKVTMVEPPGARQMLLELGEGETGFGGTAFGAGREELEDFLRDCVNGEDPAKVKEGLVPQTVFWIMESGDEVVGLVRMRHCLNERLRQSGGNIGYYVRKAQRGKGLGKAGLRLALEELRKLGVQRALVTVSPSNAASQGVAIACGGKREEPEAGADVWRYWIEL